jgi:6-phosphogluconolactonase (cycloisomerase 2 family)
MKTFNLLRVFLTLGVIVGPLPYVIANGQTIDAIPVMADFNWILAQVNASAAPINNPTFTGTVTAGASGFYGNLTGNVFGNVINPSGFIQSANPIVAPMKILQRGTGVLTRIALTVATGTTPNGICVDPKGRFLYVANNADATISAYSINPLTGVPTLIETTAGALGGMNKPYGLTCDPTGRFVYTANYAAATISKFSINQSTGALTAISAASPGGTDPYYLAVDPSGRFLYEPDDLNPGHVYMYSINQTTGDLVSLGAPIATGATPVGVAVDPKGRFVYVANYDGHSVSMYLINQSTGALTRIGADVATAASSYNITVDPTGRFVYVSNYLSTANPVLGSISMFSINQTTGALTSIGAEIATGSAAACYGIKVDPTGRFLYVTNFRSATISMYSINQIMGLLTALTPRTIAAGHEPYDLAIDPTGRFVYVSNSKDSTVSMYAIRK